MYAAAVLELVNVARAINKTGSRNTRAARRSDARALAFNHHLQCFESNCFFIGQNMLRVEGIENFNIEIYVLTNNIMNIKSSAEYRT